MSRAQIAPALLMYRILRENMVQERALEITRDAVVASGVVFMRKNLGNFTRAELVAKSDSERQIYLDEKAEGFFNATIEWTNSGPEAVGFQVHSCHFPSLCAAVGLPEVASVFCAVDAAFFGSVEPNVELIRPHTLAAGDPLCDFSLRWRSSTAQTPPEDNGSKRV
jgi:hypothetical protein